MEKPERQSTPFLGWLSGCRDLSVTDQKNKWIKLISVFTTHKRVWGYTGKFLCWECSLILKEMFCFLSPRHVWPKRCIKHPCLWVQLLIDLLGTQAFLENASLFFHVFMEPEFQGGRRNLGRQEESSPCSSLGSHCSCILQSAYQDEDGNSHRRSVPGRKHHFMWLPAMQTWEEIYQEKPGHF